VSRVTFLQIDPRESLDGTYPSDHDCGTMNAPQTHRLVRVRDLVTSGEAHRRRLAARLSLSEVAGAVRVAPTTVFRWERGERMPQGEAALRYLRFLDRLAK
jgi:DNA-binding transcriptional regulator YiaG